MHRLTGASAATRNDECRMTAADGSRLTNYSRVRRKTGSVPVRSPESDIEPPRRQERQAYKETFCPDPLCVFVPWW